MPIECRDALFIDRLRMKEAQEARGFPLVVVDPRVTMLAQNAHLHLAITPGTDVVLMNAMMELSHLRHGLFLDVQLTLGAVQRAHPFILERTAGLIVAEGDVGACIDGFQQRRII